MKVTVLGAGAWGTVLARVLATNGHEVRLWAHRPEHLAELKRTGRNERYLPGVPLDPRIQLGADRALLLRGAECVVVAVPSKAFRSVTEALADFGGLTVSVTKGIEFDTGLTMCGVLSHTAPRSSHVALSGPTLAGEVVHDNPAAIVAASSDAAAARAVQELFHRPTFRVYTSADPLGVELGGALKNVIAVAAGVCDGMGFGDNSKAALVTRAIVEIRRLGVACGAQAETFSGLSGLGDLMVTCFSKLSRNHSFGERLGRGDRIDIILHESVSVAEGYPTARSAYQVARRLNASTPIIDETYAMLYEEKEVRAALHDLIHRDSKAEDSGG